MVEALIMIIVAFALISAGAFGVAVKHGRECEGHVCDRLERGHDD